MVFAAVPVSAQEHPAEVSKANPPPEALDVGDIWHMVRHQATTPATDPKQRYLVVAPSIGSKPSTGFSGGFSTNLAFFDGHPDDTHISSLTGGLKLTQKNQTSFGSRLAMFTNDDHWFIQADNRMAWTSQSIYDLGADSSMAGSANLRYDFLKLSESAYRRVRPGLFIGGGLNVNYHTNVRAGTSPVAAFDNSSYVEYNNEHGFSSDHQNSSGPSVGVRYDTRDNGINADHGWLASATYRTFFQGFLGGDSNWQELYLDVRTYKKPSPESRQKIAFWFIGDLVTGGTAPFWDLPSIQSDGRSARGYGEGRYRGEHLLYWETEYRSTLTRNGLVGFVAFANATTVDDAESGTRLFKSFDPGAGFGFRFLLNKRSKTNLCTDYGWGKQGSRGFYLSIQEAF